MAQLYDLACAVMAGPLLERSETFDAEALAVFLHWRDGRNAIAVLETSTIDVPIGPWRALAAEDPTHWVLAGAAALETVLLGLPHDPLPEPWRTALDPTDDWRWTTVWQRLFSLTAASRVLNYLSARLVERTFGSTWLTAVSGCSWQRWNPAVPTTDRPIASLLHGDPRGPWRQPRDVRSTVLSWQTRCLGVDVPVHGGAPTIERHDTAWLALPEATIVSPVGAVVINHAQPSDLGQRMMPVHDAPGYWLDVVDRTAAGRDGEVRRTAASTVVLYDSFITSYYHCLIDYLPRVVTARELIEDHGFTIAVPTTSAATLGAVLEAFGWGYALHPVEAAPEMFDWVAVIGGCQLGIEADPDAVRWLASEAHARFGGQGPRRRLLISRADASNRRLLNEAALMALLEPHGFERVLPSTLSVAEQLSAFAAAEIVVAPHGAALANLVAARPGTRVVEITADLSLCKFYAPIAAVLGLDHTTVLARGVEADLEVNPALVLAALGYTTP